MSGGIYGGFSEKSGVDCGFPTGVEMVEEIGVDVGSSTRVGRVWEIGVEVGSFHCFCVGGGSFPWV